MLVYSKSAADLARGKKHGSLDIGMSVISTKARRRRIDIDADSNIFHLKVRRVYFLSNDLFDCILSTPYIYDQL